jgi:NAD(P)-dependent dehydrogenase (short-subunit alcohol dehydrogenase family)
MAIKTLFAKAGIGESAPLGEIFNVLFGKAFGVNVKGHLFNVQKTLTLFQYSKGGLNILNASVVSKGFGLSTVNSATKVAVRSLDRT